MQAFFSTIEQISYFSLGGNRVNSIGMIMAFNTYSEQPLDEDEGSDYDDLSIRGDDSSEGEDKEAKIDFRDNVVLATLQDGTMGKWKEAQVAYSYPLEHKVRSLAMLCMMGMRSK